jgi:hypothetical protein
MPLNVLPIPPGISEDTLVGSQVKEIVTAYNIESLDAVNQPVGKSVLWSYQGTKVTPGIGLVKVPIRFLSNQNFSDFQFGGQRDYSTIDVGSITIPTSPRQLNFRWAMMEDALGKLNLMTLKGDGTFSDFYGGTGLAQAIIEGARWEHAYMVATTIIQSMTDAASAQTATQLCLDNLPLFTNGTDSAKHLANPNNPNSSTFETLFRPGVTNRVGFTGGGFNVDWLSKMTLAMTQVPHPSLANATMELELTDVVGPTWMKIPFWQTAIQQLQLETANVGSQIVGAATTNIFNAEIVKNMGADKFIGAGGVAPQRYWTTSLFDSFPYALANQTTGPGGGPAHFALGIANMRPRVQTWCELAARDVDFTPKVKLFGPGDPQAESERMVRMLSDLDRGARPGLPHFVILFLGV